MIYLQSLRQTFSFKYIFLASQEMKVALTSNHRPNYYAFVDCVKEENDCGKFVTNNENKIRNIYNRKSMKGKLTLKLMRYKPLLYKKRFSFSYQLIKMGRKKFKQKFN